MLYYRTSVRYSRHCSWSKCFELIFASFFWQLCKQHANKSPSQRALNVDSTLRTRWYDVDSSILIDQQDLNIESAFLCQSFVNCWHINRILTLNWHFFVNPLSMLVFQLDINIESTISHQTFVNVYISTGSQHWIKLTLSTVFVNDGINKLMKMKETSVSPL